MLTQAYEPIDVKAPCMVPIVTIERPVLVFEGFVMRLPAEIDIEWEWSAEWEKLIRNTHIALGHGCWGIS